MDFAPPYYMRAFVKKKQPLLVCSIKKKNCGEGCNLQLIKLLIMKMEICIEIVILEAVLLG